MFNFTDLFFVYDLMVLFIFAGIVVFDFDC